MAFVFRSDKQTSYIQKATTEGIGPGYYSKEDQQIYTQAKPFNSSSEKWPKINVRPIPGPGQYNIGGSYDGQKVIFQSEENEIKILEIPKPISVFRSTTVRFKEQKKEMPGPAYYNIDGRPKFHSAHTKTRKPNIIEQLMQDSKYQSIPSIPGPLHKLGYMENEQNQLVLQMQEHSDTGPGYYDIQSGFHKLKSRGVSWHKPSSQEKKLEPIVGPGSYDLQQSVPMHQMKPTTAFTSKSNRYSDLKFRQTQQTRGSFHVKRGLDNKQYSFQLSTNAGSHRDSDEDLTEYSFIDDATPGPGYYENASHQSSIMHQVKNQQFGQLKSRTRRFGSVKNRGPPGPGYYNIEPERKGQHGYHPPFHTSNDRFQQKPKDLIPAPNQYKIKQTMEDKLIHKLQQAPLGQFGSNEDRFQDSNQVVPGPGTYEINRSFEKKQKTASSVFKSKSNKIEDIVIPTVSPPPGAYDQTNFTIQQQTKKVEDDDPSLAIKKPPFNTGEKRFRYNEVIKEEEEEDNPYQDRLQQSNKKKQAKSQPPFMSNVNYQTNYFFIFIKEQRFQEKSPKSPGPGQYYDHQLNPWNKRTFNIIFAEI